MNKKLTVIASIFASLMPIVATAQQPTIQLSDIMSGKFSQRGMSGLTPMADGEHYLQIDRSGKCILKGSFKTGVANDTIFNISTARGESLKYFEDFILSPTEDRLLIQTNSSRIFRHSFTADYYIFSIKNNKLERLTDGGPQQEPLFSPDGNQIAFVRDNDIYLVKLLFANAESKVSKDGAVGKIRNGIPDWAYEEEFGFTRAFDFSADSKMLAWIRFDESQVESYQLPFFSTRVDRSRNSQELITYKPQQYPTAGAANSKVSVHTFDIKSSVIRDMALPLDSNSYIPRIKFVNNDDNDLFVFTLNRRQNTLDIYAANPRSTVCNLILRETDDKYIDESTYMDTRFFNDRFIMQSERDGYNHLYLYRLNGRLEKQLTQGKFEVLALHGYDPKTGTVYYESNENGIYDKAVYKIDSKGKKTCLTPGTGTNNATFSADNKYFFNSWSTMDTPATITIRDNNGKVLKTIEENTELIARAKETGIQKKDTFSFVTSDGVRLYGWMTKPANSEPGKKYPLVMYQYSGPGSNEMTNEWNCGFYPGGSFETLLSQMGYAVAIVDGRGTGRRGSDFKKQTYLQLGVMESKDQVEAAKYLGTLPFIDKENIAIWGWSFGGYNTLMSMSEGTPVFKCGVAVAPVTDWRYYDAPYTERFMREPKENSDGYLDSSAASRVGKLHGKLLLIHGIDDDNVFFSNSTTYIEALINAGVDFDMQVYPGKDHSITGFAHRTHLFNRILRFFEENLKNGTTTTQRQNASVWSEASAY